MRLDKYLTTKYPNLSRAYIKNQIKLGNFLVFNNKKVKPRLQKLSTPFYSGAGRNPAPKAERDKQSAGNRNQRPSGARVKPSYILRQGDLVALAPGFILPDATQILPNLNIKLNIIFENDDVIVINKPAGLSVHPRQDKNGLPLPQEIDSTLVSGLLAYYPAIANVGDVSIIQLKSDFKGNPKSDFNGPGPPPLEPVLNLIQEGIGEDFFPVNVRPGIVHRLDKDTSGVMIIAKNQNSFDWLKKQFKERKTTKTYLVLAHGLLKNKEGEIKTLLVRAKGDPTKQKVSTKEGKEAITQYKVIKEFKNYSLLEAGPKTGRLHQIRVHLAHLGHPVVGDTKYGSKKLPTPPGLTRQFLHAAKLKITLPDGQKKTLYIPLPTELKQIIKTLDK